MIEFKRHYYHATVRRTLIGLGNVFSELKIIEYKPKSDDEDIGETSIGKTRYNEELDDRRPTDIIEMKKVAIEYGPKEKYITLLEERENVEDVAKLPLPRMYFEINDIYYDSERKQSTKLQYETQVELPTTPILETPDVYVNYTPVPYDVNFEVGLFTRSDDEAWQIIEQILPLFQPDYNIDLVMNDDTKERRDISYLYKGLGKIDNWIDNFDKTRAILHVLNFTAKSYLYGPIRKEKAIVAPIIRLRGQE